MGIYGTLIPAFTKGREQADATGHAPEPLPQTQFTCLFDGLTFGSIVEIQKHAREIHPRVRITTLQQAEAV